MFLGAASVLGARVAPTSLYGVVSHYKGASSQATSPGAVCLSALGASVSGARVCLRMAGAQENLPEINIASDAAGHFRVFESLFHLIVIVAKQRKCVVRTHYGCEKDMKAEADELFGWGGNGLESSQLKVLMDSAPKPCPAAIFLCRHTSQGH